MWDGETTLIDKVARYQNTFKDGQNMLYFLQIATTILSPPSTGSQSGGSFFFFLQHDGCDPRTTGY